MLLKNITSWRGDKAQTWQAAKILLHFFQITGASQLDAV